MWSKNTDTVVAARSAETQPFRDKNKIDLVIDQSVLRNICLIMSAVLCLFGFNNLSTGFSALGAVDLVLAAAMLLNAVLLFFYQPTLLLVLVTLFAGGTAVILAIYANAFGIYWSYVIVVASFLVVNKRAALIYNVAFIAVVVPLSAELLGNAIGVRMAITLSLVTAFSYIFSMRIENRTKALLENLDELDNANSVKSEFIANMSHEMRTPLTAVLGYSENLASRNELSPTDREKLEAVVFGAKHLAALIDDVLDLNKAEKGQLEVDSELTNLPALLDNFLRILKPEADSKGIGLEFTKVSSIPDYILIDARRLNQILMNLVANAIKFTEEGTVGLAVTYKNDSSSLVFEVTDTGVGVPEEFRSELFEKFSQANTGMNRTHGGAGLGLYISQNLARLLDGDIEYVPQERGSLFRLTIKTEEVTGPVETEQTAPESPQPDTLSAPQQFQGHILIAEDSPANQMLVGLIVEKFGLTHSVANNGREAVEAMNSESFDLILMDLQMPVMSGIDATKAIREFNHDIPIVALSADVLRHDTDSSEMRQFSGFLPKPVDVAKMEATFANLLNAA
ncbi:ATP-binding protein [Congregibacter brevis]|uniref:histidine kinase n=1 Tax=Congregibacter brevis TaxID=3081201 RepID=A0ABZ0I9I2_9GAMM|nr:ATP-binding protein [Congregibacter sp. IMCC45268]